MGRKEIAKEKREIEGGSRRSGKEIERNRNRRRKEK